MKKKRLLIALAVVLSAGACVAPWWRQMWFGFAYKTTPKVGNRVGGMEHHEKRFTWLPGPPMYSPDQPCLHCVEGSHSECYVRWKWMRHPADADIWAFTHAALLVLPVYQESPQTRISCYCTCPECHPDRQ